MKLQTFNKAAVRVEQNAKIQREIAYDVERMRLNNAITACQSIVYGGYHKPTQNNLITKQGNNNVNT